MDLLRRALYLKALESALGGLALVIVPRFLLVSVLGQPEYRDYAFVRMLGVADLSLALVITLVAHRLEELWWWSWAFLVLAAGTAAVVTLHAAFGLPEEASPWMWWALGLFDWAIAAGVLWGIARTGEEAPPP